MTKASTLANIPASPYFADHQTATIPMTTITPSINPYTSATSHMKKQMMCSGSKFHQLEKNKIGGWRSKKENMKPFRLRVIEGSRSGSGDGR